MALLIPMKIFQETKLNPPKTYQPKLNNVRGILWMLAAVTTLTTMFAIVKQMSTEVPIFVVALARTFFALCMLIPWLLRNGKTGVQTKRTGLHFVRAFSVSLPSFASYLLSNI